MEKSAVFAKVLFACMFISGKHVHHHMQWSVTLSQQWAIFREACEISLIQGFPPRDEV